MAEPALNSDYPEVLSEMVGIVQATLVDEGFDCAVAGGLALSIVERVRSTLGGCYLPSGTAVDIERIRAGVAQRWNGRNTRELCREYSISERTLRRYAKEGNVKQSAF